MALVRGALHPCEQLYEVEMVFTTAIIITEYKVASRAAHQSAFADYNQELQSRIIVSKCRLVGCSAGDLVLSLGLRGRVSQ